MHVSEGPRLGLLVRPTMNRSSHLIEYVPSTFDVRRTIRFKLRASVALGKPEENKYYIPPRNGKIGRG